MIYLSSADFFQMHFFRKIIYGIPSGCQTLWIQIRTDRMSKLFAKVVSTQQPTKVAASKERVDASIAKEKFFKYFKSV